MENIDLTKTFEMLISKDNNAAYEALRILQDLSEKTDTLYPYIDQLSNMLDSDNSYIRTRALTLIAYNAKWDKNHKIDKMIDKYLHHITDVKPITARQCIKMLPVIAKSKPNLKEDITYALHKANVCRYSDSMQQLIYNDIQKALSEIKKQVK